MKALSSHLLEFGEFRLDLEERLLLRDGASVPLTPRVFETLRYLVEHSGRVVEKRVLMEAVWPDCIVEENNLAQNISTLRRIFGDSPSSQRYIATVPGRGYRFVADVKTRENGAPSMEPMATATAPTTAEAQVRPTPASPPPPAARRNFQPVTIAAGAFCLLGLGAFFFFRGQGRQPVVPPNRATVAPVAIPEKKHRCLAIRQPE